MRLSLLDGVAVCCREIAAGDEAFLSLAERNALGPCAPVVRRRAATARLAAREVLAEAGWPDWQLPCIRGRGPRWPDGMCGSLSHADTDAAAALARTEAWLSVGIDVEGPEPIDPDVLGLVATPSEIEVLGGDLAAGKRLFCAKEAAYKAMFIADGVYLDPHDITVDPGFGHAVARYGRRAVLASHCSSRIVMLAGVRDAGSPVSGS